MCILGQLGHKAHLLIDRGDGPPINQLRIDNWPEPEGDNCKYTHGVSG